VPPDVDGEYIAFYSPEVNAQARRAFLLLGSAAAAHDVVADVFVEVYRDGIGSASTTGGVACSLPTTAAIRVGNDDGSADVTPAVVGPERAGRRLRSDLSEE
jgi:hypothetical protein